MPRLNPKRLPFFASHQIPYPEDFDDLKLPDGSVDTIVSTFMW